MSVSDCLPEALRGEPLARFPSGLSGAEVYRVGSSHVLKIAASGSDDWHGKLAVLRLASDAGLAPRVIHVDEARRAVVSELVTDRGLMPFLMSPATRARAIAMLGTTLRRVHELPIVASTLPAEPHALLAKLAASFAPGYVPAFARDFVTRVIAEVSRSPEPLVTSHNDVNPSNLIFDGERIVLLDWDVAGANDRYYDLAAAALFMRFDDAACLALLSAHDGAAVTSVPARFAHQRRLVAATCGTIFMHLARTGGFTGATGETLASVLPLADAYAKLRAGELDVGTPAGQWQLGLALIQAGAT